nr:unnamed protein product [Digitaria exilis]
MHSVVGDVPVDDEAPVLCCDDLRVLLPNEIATAFKLLLLIASRESMLIIWRPGLRLSNRYSASNGYRDLVERVTRPLGHPEVLGSSSNPKTPGLDRLYMRLDRLGPIADLAMCQANNPRFAASDGVPPEVVIVGFRGASSTDGLTGPYRRSSGEENLDNRAI